MEINPQLMFHLHQQCFIELIQKKEYTEALEFSSTKLAPVAEKNVILQLISHFFMQPHSENH